MFIRNFSLTFPSLYKLRKNLDQLWILILRSFKTNGTKKESSVHFVEFHKERNPYQLYTYFLIEVLGLKKVTKKKRFHKKRFVSNFSFESPIKRILILLIIRSISWLYHARGLGISQFFWCCVMQKEGGWVGVFSDCYVKISIFLTSLLSNMSRLPVFQL